MFLRFAFMLWFAAALYAQVCQVSTSGLNRSRQVTGPIHAECPVTIHSVPFGNWGVTSNFGQKLDGNQFQGWCHETRTCDNTGNCRTECRDGWYEWNSCTDVAQFQAPNCTLYNDKNCTAQASRLGENSHGTRPVDVTVRCPTDTNADGVSDQGGCADLKTFSNGTNFMSFYEIDPGTTDDLIQTLYFPDMTVSLNCTIFGCSPAQSSWAGPIAFDSPTLPPKIFAEFSMTVNSATFVDTSRACRATGRVLSTVSAASFRGPAVAPESIVSAFGTGLAFAALNATTLPLPADLGGTRVNVTDSAGVTRGALLFYVSPNQVNFQIPIGTAVGAGQVNVVRSDAVTSLGPVQVTPTSPALFAANATGQGLAAATAVRLTATGVVPVSVSQPIALNAGSVFLSLYGTGIRGASSVTATIGGVSAQVTFTGAHTTFVGLDQVNVLIPASLAGRGTVEVQLTIASTTSNSVTITLL